MKKYKILNKTKLAFITFLIFFVSSCLPNKQSFSDYSERMYYAKTYFPELYELYNRGEIIITDVYQYGKKGQEKIGISYRYR